MKINQVIEGLKDPKDNPCWKGYKPVGTKQKGGRTVPNCVPKESVAEGSGPKEKQKTPYRDINSAEYRAAAEKQKQQMAKDKLAEPGKKLLAKKGVAEAFGPLPKDNQQIRLGRHTVDIERVGLDKNYISFAWHDSKGQEHYEEVPVGDLGSYDDLIKKIKQEISYQERQYTDQGVAEGKKCPQCGSTNCTCPPGKCNCKPVEGWVPKQASLNEEEYDYYRDYKAGLISYDEYQRLVQQFKDRDRDQRNRERDNDRGPWYLKVNGKILKSRGEVKVFDWKRGANNYALAILKNKPELNGKIYLTRKPEDDQAGVNESKTTVKVPVKQKPRQGPLRPQTGGGAHRDKKKEQKQGKEKHKKPVYEGFDPKVAMELEKLTKADDMFDAIYNALGRNDQVGSYLQDMMYDVARENRLHPDDDIESIIDIMADHLESDFGSSGLDETGTLKVAKDDDNMTILQNPATGVQTQIDKKNPNAPRLTQDETGKLKLSVPQGAQTGQQGQEKKPNLIGKDVAVDSSPVEDVHRISASPVQPGGEITDVNTKSTISGDEEHDEISKLLNQRLRKLAGL